MQRVKTANAVAEKPAYTETGTPGYFSSGDAVAARDATVPGPQWFNMVQEELLAVLLAAGLVPSAMSDTQLRDAIEALIAAALDTITLPEQATDAAQGIVELATDAEAIAGTDIERAVTPHALGAALSAHTVTLEQILMYS